MSTELKLVLLARFATAPEAQMVEELLLREGIETILSGTSDPLGVVSGAQPLVLYVAENDLPRAQEVYQAFFRSDIPEQGDVES
jgi:hypothetical protein